MQSIWILVSAFLFSLMAVIIKVAQADFGSLELIFYRSIFGIIAIYAFVRSRGYTIATPHLFSHFKRSFAGTLGMALWFVSLGLLPLGTSITLANTTPLVMGVIVIATAMWMRRPVPWALLATIVAGFTGVLIIVRPSFGSEQLIGAAFSLGSALLSAVAYWQIKQLGQLKEPSWRIVFYFTLFGTVFGLIGCYALEGGLHPITMTNAMYLIGIGLTATLAQLALTRGFGQGNLLLSSCLQYSGIVFAVMFDVIFFGLSVEMLTLLGIAVIFVAGVSASVITKRIEKAASKS